jgi:hypothetical protein
VSGAIDRDTVAMLLALTAEQIASRDINDVKLHVRDSHGYREDWAGRKKPGSTTRRRIVTITVTVEGSHGDAWYHASAGQAFKPEQLAPPVPVPEEPKALSAMPWTCGNCGHMNGAGATTCRYCKK